MISVAIASCARRRAESGSATPLLVVFAICLLLAISAVIDISGSYLRRQSATSLADGASLAVADAAAAAAIYGEPDDDFVAFDERAARAAIDDYLGAVSAYSTYPGLDVAVDVVGHVVTVELSVPYDLPVSMPGTPHIVVIHAESSAEMPIY